MKRQLSCAENFFALTLPSSPRSAMTLSVALQIEGYLSRESIVQACEWLQVRHPAFRSCLSKNAKGFMFIEESGNPQPIPVHRTSTAWEDVFEKQLNADEYDLEVAPLCDIYLCDSNKGDGRLTLVARFQHALVDGISGLTFCHELLSIASQVMQNKNIEIPIPLTMAQNPEKSLSVKWSLKKIVNIVKGIVENKIYKPTLVVDGRAVPDHKERNTYCEFRVLELSRVRQLAASFNASVHTILVAAALKSAYQSIRHLGNASASQVLRYAQAVNLRPYTNGAVTNEEMVNAISIVSLLASVKEDMPLNDWVALVSKQFFNAKKDETHLMAGLLPPIALDAGKVFSEVDSVETGGRKGTVFVSNLGKYQQSTTLGDISLKGVHMATGQHVQGNMFWVFAVTLDDKIHLTTAFVEPLIHREEALGFIDGMLACIQSPGELLTQDLGRPVVEGLA